MSIDVGATTVIERPIAEVSASAGDPAKVPEWSRRVVSAEWRTDPPTRLGSRILFHSRLLGRSRDDLFEVFEWTPGEQVALRTVASRFPITVTSTWRPVGDRVTHMAVRFHAEPRGLRRLLAPLVRRIVRRALPRDLAALTQLLEG